METVANPGRLINRAARLYGRWAESRFSNLKLAVAQVPVLVALKDGSALTQKQLARLAQTEQPTMAQLLARMERDGLIERKPDEKDKRSSLISLTPLASSKLPAARKILQEADRVLLNGLTDREITTLDRLLSKVLENLAHAVDDAN